MKNFESSGVTSSRLCWSYRAILTMAAVLVFANPALAQSPWEDAIERVMVAFTGPIARGLGLVSIVVGGLLWAFGEGTKHTLAGILFGVAMAVGAVNFYEWLFR